MALLHDVEAETLQITPVRKIGCRNPTNMQVCGPRQPPNMQKTLQIPRFHAECCKTQVLGPYHGGGGGGGSEPRTGIILYTCHAQLFDLPKAPKKPRSNFAGLMIVSRALNTCLVP